MNMKEQRQTQTQAQAHAHAQANIKSNIQTVSCTKIQMLYTYHASNSPCIHWAWTNTISY